MGGIGNAGGTAKLITAAPPSPFKQEEASKAIKVEGVVLETPDNVAATITTLQPEVVELPQGIKIDRDFFKKPGDKKDKQEQKDPPKDSPPPASAPKP